MDFIGKKQRYLLTYLLYIGLVFMMYYFLYPYNFSMNINEINPLQVFASFSTLKGIFLLLFYMVIVFFVLVWIQYMARFIREKREMKEMREKEEEDPFFMLRGFRGLSDETAEALELILQKMRREGRAETETELIGFLNDLIGNTPSDSEGRNVIIRDELPSEPSQPIEIHREFQITDHLKVRLDNNKTTIYIGGQEFKQCKYLLFQLDPKNFQKYDNIESIDDMVKEDLSAEYGDLQIDPEQEFQAHCSNLEAWVENDYDTRLLHSNLAFPLLRKLKEEGDIKAEFRFKEELKKRVVQAKPDNNLFEFFRAGGYFKELNIVDLLEIYYKIDNRYKEEIYSYLNSEALEVLSNKLGEYQHQFSHRYSPYEDYDDDYVCNPKIVRSRFIQDIALAFHETRKLWELIKQKEKILDDDCEGD